MAVADLGVAMGPRSRRRLTTGGIGVAVIAAGVTVVLLTRPPMHAGHSAASVSRPPAGAFSLYAGMSEAQVLRVAGQPAAKRGSCWLYHTNHEVRGGRLDAVRACFFATHVYELRYEVDGKWLPPPPSRIPPH